MAKTWSCAQLALLMLTSIITFAVTVCLIHAFPDAAANFLATRSVRFYEDTFVAWARWLSLAYTRLKDSDNLHLLQTAESAINRTRLVVAFVVFVWNLGSTVYSTALGVSTTIIGPQQTQFLHRVIVFSATAMALFTTAWLIGFVRLLMP